MSTLYITFDSAPQTFFYTLSNMLKLNEAKNVLEIACGAGKLIPQVLDLKAPETFYYATDISEEMINFAKIRL
jgi:ubiquinone/menaquinone biosynthesis C-methylase UbiE